MCVCACVQCNCAMIPLRGDEPLSIVDSFRRIFMLLSAGLFLPGSIGIPDPCEVREWEEEEGEGREEEEGRVCSHCEHPLSFRDE